MFAKFGVFFGVLVMGALWATGVLGGPAYSRDVARPLAEVAQELADLDLTKQPGAPATDPARSGGLKSVFRLEQVGNELHWVVTNGDQTAVTMIAALTAVDATHTRVTARVERGDAPDDFVAPAFRSTGVTMGLFGMALEDRLNALTKPPQQSQDACAEVFANLMHANFGDVPSREPETLSGAIAHGAKQTMKLTAVAAEARRQGCEPRGFDDTAMSTVMAMKLAPEHANRSVDSEPPDAFGARDAVRFEPGKPMISANPAFRH